MATTVFPVRCARCSRSLDAFEWERSEKHYSDGACLCFSCSIDEGFELMNGDWSDRRILPAIGANIRKARGSFEWGMPLTELARRTGISRAHLHNIESGKQDFTIVKLYAIAQALEVSVETLLPPSNRGQKGSE